MRAAASLLTTGLLIAGCAQKPAPAPAVAIAPDPFGYMPHSALCTLGPVTPGPSGRSATMTVRSDDGSCTLSVSQPQGGAYASFLLQELPAHGKTFIHNYDNQTLVSYTASTAYAGPDSFTVSLVPADGGPRSLLRVVANVDATGVARPVAPVPYVAPAETGRRATTHHAATRKARVVTKKKAASASN